MSIESLRSKMGVSYVSRYRCAVIWGNRGYYLEIAKFSSRLDAVKCSLKLFKHGVDYVRIESLEG